MVTCIHMCINPTQGLSSHHIYPVMSLNTFSDTCPLNTNVSDGNMSLIPYKPCIHVHYLLTVFENGPKSLTFLPLKISQSPPHNLHKHMSASTSRVWCKWYSMTPSTALGQKRPYNFNLDLLEHSLWGKPEITQEVRGLKDTSPLTSQLQFRSLL